jgi:c-di-GMP-binding flagellar brake protein YcgR
VSNTEKRKYPRVKIFSLISYSCINEEGEILDRNYGTALDISQGGIMLETVSIIETEYVLLMAFDLENNMIEIKGKVAYCRKNGSGRFRTGISFQETHQKNIQFASSLVRTYHSQKGKN